MPMRLELGLLLALLAGPVQAGGTAMSCVAAAGLLTQLTGYTLSLPGNPNAEGWCIADRVALRSDGRPRITVERLWLQVSASDGEPDSLSLIVDGLRVTPDLNDRTMDKPLREMLRLQTVDATLTLRRSTVFDGLELRRGLVTLSGGSKAAIEADLAGAGLSARAMLPARLTGLHLEWWNDGRILRPLMEAAGETFAEGKTGTAAVDAAREALQGLTANLPGPSLVGETASGLRQLSDALPQGRGRLAVDFVSDAGIGGAQLAILALSDDPAGPEALARLFAGSRLTVEWQDGTAP
jgi:hypothetical protein